MRIQITLIDRIKTINIKKTKPILFSFCLLLFSVCIANSAITLQSISSAQASFPVTRGYFISNIGIPETCRFLIDYASSQKEEVIAVASEDLVSNFYWCLEGKMRVVGLDERFFHSEPFLRMASKYSGKHMVFIFRADWDSHLLTGFRKAFPEQYRFKKIESTIATHTQTIHLFRMSIKAGS